MHRTNPLKLALYASAALALIWGSYALAAPGDKPVFVYLYAKATDHVNVEMTEDRLRHILPAVEKYRKAHPELHASATILFSGAASKALEDRNRQTHIVDYVKDYIRQGVIEAGYDGADEPTYNVRPTLKLSLEQSPSERWKIRQSIAGQFLSEARDPLTGAPAQGSGGLKKMQDVFGKAAYAKGLDLALETYRPAPRVREDPNAHVPPPSTFSPRYGVFRETGGDTEIIQALKQFNTGAIMFGIPVTNPSQLPGYTEAITRFGELMGDGPDTAPELYWQDNVLRLSEAAPPVRLVKASGDIDALKGVLGNVNRSKVQIIEVELGPTENYLKSDFAKTAANAPIQYAYDHPDAPTLPANVLLSKEETAAAWAKEDSLLKWVSEDFFASNSGSQFVSNAALSKMAGSPSGFRVSTASLRTEVAHAFEKQGQNTYIFNFVRADGHYLSLAELFQVLTDELAEYHRTGKLPDSVQVTRTYGPFRLVTGHGPNAGEVTAGDLESYCASIAASLHDESSNDVPRNSVPPAMKINNMDLNPAQLLRLMSLALDNPAPATKLPVRMLHMTGEAGGIVPKSRILYDVGFVWTIKPAALAVN